MFNVIDTCEVILGLYITNSSVGDALYTSGTTCKFSVVLRIPCMNKKMVYLNFVAMFTEIARTNCLGKTVNCGFEVFFCGSTSSLFLSLSLSLSLFNRHTVHYAPPLSPSNHVQPLYSLLLWFHRPHLYNLSISFCFMRTQLIMICRIEVSIFPVAAL